MSVPFVHIIACNSDAIMIINTNCRFVCISVLFDAPVTFSSENTADCQVVEPRLEKASKSQPVF